MCLGVSVTWDGLEKGETVPIVGSMEASGCKYSGSLLPLALCICFLPLMYLAYFPRVHLTHSYLVVLQDSGIPTPILPRQPPSLRLGSTFSGSWHFCRQSMVFAMGHSCPLLRLQGQGCVLFISEPSMPSTEPGTYWIFVCLLNEGKYYWSEFGLGDG